MTGRGAWTKVGMPANGSEYYGLVTPVNVGSQPTLDSAHRAVMYGVKAIQTRINEAFGFTPKLDTDGWLGPKTSTEIIAAQKILGLVADGEAGPKTMKALLWPVVKQIAGTNAKIVGGLAQHESGWDPGAVGYQDDHDIGLVQINGPANPTLTEAQRFDYRIAFKYAADRIAAALGTPGYTLDSAICSYGYPAVAAYWARSQTETFPSNPTLNVIALAYVAYVKAWTAPS